VPADHDLLAQGQDLHAKLMAATEEAANVEEQGNNELGHEISVRSVTGSKIDSNANC
jgi:hypothetical protein